MVLVALAMVPLLGLTALGVDIGLTFFRLQTLRNGVDAGVLAGMRFMRTGTIPTDLQIENEINRLLQANTPGAVIETMNLINGPGPDADDCMASPVRQPLLGAGATSIGTAHCMEVIARLTFNTTIAQVIGIPSMTVKASAIAAATPVTAMGGLRPLGLPETASVTGMATFLWGQQFGSQWLDNLEPPGIGKTCAQWAAVPLPHRRVPDFPGFTASCVPAAERVDLSATWQGLLNFAAPPNPPNEHRAPSSGTACHWHEHDGTDNGSANWNVGWNNPTNRLTGGTPHDHLPLVDGSPINVWTLQWLNPPAPPGGIRFERDPNQNACETSSDIIASLNYWAEFGFGGTVWSGDPTQGEGDFFTLYQGNLGQNFSGGFNNACPNGQQYSFFVPVFDGFADPNHSYRDHNGNRTISVHVRTFAAIQVDCDIPTAGLTGLVVNGAVPPQLVKASAGTCAAPPTPCVTVIKLVS